MVVVSSILASRVASRTWRFTNDLRIFAGFLELTHRALITSFSIVLLILGPPVNVMYVSATQLQVGSLISIEAGRGRLAPTSSNIECMQIVACEREIRYYRSISLSVSLGRWQALAAHVSNILIASAQARRAGNLLGGRAHLGSHLHLAPAPTTPQVNHLLSLQI